jgi:pyruvate formate lyase activating enzyme
MIQQGHAMGKCLTNLMDGSKKPACQSTLKHENGQYHRLIKSFHLSRPEDYLSIYQSGCNHDCLKCHSFEFSQYENGFWMSTDDIADAVAEYEATVTVWEPRERALMITASDLCHHCGRCVLEGKKGDLCPQKLSPDKIIFGPQGWGPARNIIAFTGGDITCQADFYAEVTEKIKEKCEKMWVLIETNGFGMTPQNLDKFQSAGVDSYWLDIKAYDPRIYKKLCGTSNETVLAAPAEIIDRGFALEVLSLFIPNWVEFDELEKIGRLVADVDKNIPFTILAFFPVYKMKDGRSPNLMEMLKAYAIVKDTGLKTVKLGNLGQFVKSNQDLNILLSVIGKEGIG